jgi:hypothetical protein
LNWLYAICQAELTLALIAAGLDDGIAMFHVDMDHRSSLALDGIEALRPYVDLWLFSYLANSVFANRDFTELRDGEVRLTHPLNSHLAHTAALWRQVSEPVAGWLKESFIRAAETTLADTRLWPSLGTQSPPHPDGRSRAKPAARPIPAPIAPLAPLLPALAPSALPVPAAASLRGGLRDDPVPRMCWECGRALTAGRRAFCSNDCAENYRWAMGKRRPIVAAITRASYDRHREATLAGQQAARMLPASEREALRRWYQKELQPRLSKMSANEIMQSTAMGRTYAYHIIAGTRTPHPRHYPNLATLAGVDLPSKFAAALSAP